MERLRQRAQAGRIPVSASIALTHRCNLRCVHCYARTSADSQQELSAAAWCGMIDQLTEAGCLFLLITGGEPLCRPDFAGIYRHARERGMIVTVFTNATLIDDATIALFRELPPRLVDVTLYGMSEETCRRVTGVPDVFAACRANLRRLGESGIKLGLKTVAMTLNRHEIPAMEAAARELGVAFRLDGAIFPRYDGDRTPLEVRLPAEEVADLELADPDRAAKWSDFVKRHTHIPDVGTGTPLYRCSAGRTHAHIDPAGWLHPCLSVNHIGYPLAGRPFGEAWTAVGRDLAGRLMSEDSPCIRCMKHLLCGYCPGFSLLESGNESARCDYQCELGEARLRRIGSISS